MIVNKEYILNVLSTGKSFRPESNASGALLKAYSRPSDVANFKFKLEQHSSGKFMFKHVATGLYLTDSSPGAPGAELKIYALSGDDVQLFTIEGGDTGAMIFPNSGGRCVTVAFDTDGTVVSLQPTNYENPNAKISFSETSVNTLTAPIPEKIFKNQTSVLVNNIQPGADVRLYFKGVLISTQTNDNDTFITMNLPLMQVGDEIQFEQVVAGITSPKSETMKVNLAVGIRKLGTKFRAMAVTLTNSSGNNTKLWQGGKGDTIGSLRDTQAEALADIIAAGYNTQTYGGTGIGTGTGDCTETLTNAQKTTLDNYANSVSSAYSGNFMSIIWRNNELYYKAYGSANRTTQLSVASVGKHFAATVLMKLVDEGLLSLTTKTDIIPSMAANGKGNITLKQLMSHTSGLLANSSPSGGEGPYEDQRNITTAQAVDLIAANVPLTSTPGTVWEYGGVHWCVASRMAEIVTGKTWMQICREKILDPLGMTSTDYKLGLPGETDPLNPTVHAGLRTTLDDWTKFMRMRLKLGMFGATRIMSEASILAMEIDQTGINAGYGFGLYIETNEVFHHGATGCGVSYNRDKKYAMAIFTTVYGGTAIDENETFRGLVRDTMTAAPSCS